MRSGIRVHQDLRAAWGESRVGIREHRVVFTVLVGEMRVCVAVLLLVGQSYYSSLD